MPRHFKGIELTALKRKLCLADDQILDEVTSDAELEDLRKRMEAAAASMDFEEASRLRDRISLLRGQPDAAVNKEIDTSGLTRQRPGAMGLGTSDQKMVPPADWKRPVRPAPMTAGHQTPRRRR